MAVMVAFTTWDPPVPTPMPLLVQLARIALKIHTVAFKRPCGTLEVLTTASAVGPVIQLTAVAQGGFSGGLPTPVNRGSTTKAAVVFSKAQKSTLLRRQLLLILWRLLSRRKVYK